MSKFSDLRLCSSVLSRSMATAQGLIDFIHASPTPFHLVETAGAMLTESRFTKLDERQSWRNSITAGGKYFYSRNRSTIVAFTVGGNYAPGGEFKVKHNDEEERLDGEMIENVVVVRLLELTATLLC